MKKITAAVICVLLLFLAACANDADAPGNIDKCKVTYGTSALYSEDELQNAVDLIQDQFKELRGCVLHSLTYACDERCEQELASRNASDAEEKLTAVIVFDSSFRSPKKARDAWNADEEYTWSWYVGQTENGTWKLVGYGYA